MAGHPSFCGCSACRRKRLDAMPPFNPPAPPLKSTVKNTKESLTEESPSILSFWERLCHNCRHVVLLVGASQYYRLVSKPRPKVPVTIETGTQPSQSPPECSKDVSFTNSDMRALTKSVTLVGETLSTLERRLNALESSVNYIVNNFIGRMSGEDK